MTVKIECAKREIITSQDIQNDYAKFYPYMMKHLWDLRTVMDLANLEIAIFKIFPDKEEMQKYFEVLAIDIKDTFNDEDDPDYKEFQKVFNTLKEDIELYEDVGYEIFRIEEAVNVESILEENKEDKSKKTIQVGKIVRR